MLINEHPEEFEGVTDAVGEVGGFSTTVRGRRIYLIEAAEKGMAWMKLTARGRAGHGSMINHDNAVARLSAAVARLGAHEWPIRLTPDHGGAARHRRRAGRHRGDARQRPRLVDEFGGATRMLGAVISNTVNPTMLSAGYKVNVSRPRPPPTSTRRSLPGYEDEFFDTLRS